MGAGWQATVKLENVDEVSNHCVEANDSLLTTLPRSSRGPRTHVDFHGTRGCTCHGESCQPAARGQHPLVLECGPAADFRAFSCGHLRSGLWHWERRDRFFLGEARTAFNLVRCGARGAHAASPARGFLESGGLDHYLGGFVFVCKQRIEHRKGIRNRILTRCTANILSNRGARDDRGIGHRISAGELLPHCDVKIALDIFKDVYNQRVLGHDRA